GRANPFGVMSVTGVGVPVQTSSPSLSSRKTVSVTVQLVKFTPVTPQPLLPVLQLSTLISPWLTQSPPTDPCVSHVFWISAQGVRQQKLAVSEADVWNLISFSAVQKQFSVTVSGSLAAKLTLQVLEMGSRKIVPPGGIGQSVSLVQWVTPSSQVPPAHVP